MYMAELRVGTFRRPYLADFRRKFSVRHGLRLDIAREIEPRFITQLDV